jgi:hypothetical protein
MKRVVLSALLSLSFAHAAHAQGGEELNVRRASKKYDLAVRVRECSRPEQEGDPEACSGPARVSFYRKGAGTPFQTLDLPHVEIGRTKDEYYGFVFDDFNFDGAEDVAVRNGNDGAYNSATYTVFLFDPKSRRFVENRRLTRLAEGEYLGLFSVDRKRRLLVTESKAGCCYHETARFRVVNNRPVLVEKITEQATGRGDGRADVETTTGRRVGRRWVKTFRRKTVEGF